MSKWVCCDLWNIAEIQTGPFGSQLKNNQYITGGTPVVTVEHIINFRIANFNYPSVTEEDRVRLEKYLLKTGDIVFTRVGSVDLSAWVGSDQNGWMFSSRMLRVRPSKIVYSRFLSYFFQQKKFRKYILNISVGATMPSINTEILKGLPISYPPLPEQKAIAGVLSRLDDKIDLLHRQNKILEAMSEPLFRQWFVEEAEEDWGLVKLGDFVTTNKSSLKKDSNILEIKYLDTSSLTEGKINNLQYLPLKEAPSRAKRLVRHNDILISTVRPNQKHYGIIRNPDNNLIVSTGYCVISCNKINPFFVYVMLTTSEMTEYLHSIAEGSTSTYPSLKPEDLEKLEFHNPPQERLDDFSTICHGVWNKVERNYLQISILENLRDNLLPKFMRREGGVII
ncbi:MAG: restriction endonuclease subunit S [Bacteroidales bacterium]|nr:restriction endonuclease subunit S [Bacteroidales bacterium]